MAVTENKHPHNFKDCDEEPAGWGVGEGPLEVTFEPQAEVSYCGEDWVQNILDGGRGQLSAKET